jgi:hypothetical protein
MGLTIHYGLQMSGNDPALALKQVERLRRRALALPFEAVGEIKHRVGAECLAEHDRLHRFAIRGTDELAARVEEIIGFSVEPGEGCESAEFGLRRLGGVYDWQAYCKTAYATGGGLNFLRCHLAVIAMLDHAQELGLLRWVDDEGGYWERRDWVDLLLRHRGGEMTPANLLAVSDQLYEWFGPVREKAAFVMQEE